MLRQLGRPLRLDRGYGLKDLLINTHLSSLLSLFFSPRTSPHLPLSPPLTLWAALKPAERMERPATADSEKASPLLASSFVLLEGERRLSPFPPSISTSCSGLPSLYFLYDQKIGLALFSFLHSYYLHLSVFYALITPSHPVMCLRLVFP